MVRLKEYFLFWKKFDKPISVKDYGITQILAVLTGAIMFGVMMLPWMSLESTSDGSGYYIYLGHLNGILMLFIANALQQVVLLIRLTRRVFK